LLSTDGNCYEKARGDPRSNPSMGCGSHSRDGQRPWGDDAKADELRAELSNKIMASIKARKTKSKSN
jgi:hypothetical protein